MKNQLIADINNYIDHLNASGLNITVHGKYISGLLSHNIHNNPFCALVKTDPQAWQKCIRCQQRVFKEHQKGMIFGSCYAGVEEYVYFVNDKTFISVSGYGIHREQAQKKIERLSREFLLRKEDLLQAYDNGLRHDRENISSLTAVIKPLCHMLTLLHIWISEEENVTPADSAFDAILSYVHANYMKDITIADIGHACSYSESSISHLFKKNCKISVQKYIHDLRIKQAIKLLSTTNLRVSQIAELCGYQNINYFSTYFKKIVGSSPTKYRKSRNIP